MDSHLDELAERVGVQIDSFRDKVASLQWNLYDESCQDKLDSLSCGLYFNIKFEMDQFMETYKNRSECDTSARTYSNITLAKECFNSKMNELYGQLNMDIDEFKDKFLITVCNANNASKREDLNSLCNDLFLKLKLDIDQSIRIPSEGNETEDNMDRSLRDKKMEYLIKLQTISSRITCELLSDFMG